MGVQDGGLSGYTERTLLLAFFGQTVSLTPPATMYVGLATVPSVDYSNFGAAVTYGAATLIDSTAVFGVNTLVGAWVSAGGSTGTVQSNTNTTITLTGNWTGGTPTAASQYDVFLYSEPSGNSYARVGVTNDSTGFVQVNAPPNFSGCSIGTAIIVNFPVATSAGWGLIHGAFLSDSGTANEGNMIAAQPLSVPITVLGGQTIAIPVGGFQWGLV